MVPDSLWKGDFKCTKEHNYEYIACENWLSLKYLLELLNANLHSNHVITNTN